MGIVRDLYMARKMSAGVNIPAPSVAQYIKRRRLAGAGSAEYEGDIVEFDTPAAKKLKELSIIMSPIQDLNGYDYPWPGGGGVNKFDKTTATANSMWTESGIAEASNSNRSDYIPVTPNTNYYANWSGRGSLWGMYFFNGNKEYISRTIPGEAGNTVITTPNDCYFIGINIQDSEIDTASLNYPATVTTYSPYENECPITGRTGASAYVNGVNQWDEEWELGYIDPTTGGNASSSSCIRAKNYIPVKPNATYYINVPDASGVNAKVLFYDIEKQRTADTLKTKANDTLEIPDNVYYLRFYMSDAYGTTYNNDISINYPSTDTDYHAYQGNLFSVDWTDEAGTVYSGTVDIVTGVLRVRPEYASYNGETLVGEWMSSMDKYVAGTTPTIGAQVVDLGGEETVYQLTPQQVMSLVGSNVIWSPDGSVKVRV